MRQWSAWFASAVLLTPVAMGCATAHPSTPRLTVGAAASLEPLFREITPEFEREMNVQITFEFAASGVIARQIEQGAPIDVFASADRSFTQQLTEAGAVNSASVRSLGEGQLVVVTRQTMELAQTWVDAATSPANRHVALANPELAPYGRAARQALQHHGALELIERKIVFGENVTQALQFALQGSADAAFVSRAQIAAGLQNDLSWLPVDACDHDAIEQTVAVTAATPHADLANAFITFMTNPSRAPVIERFGYAPASSRSRCAGQ